MPEGPTMVLLKEALAPFKGKKVLEVAGNAKIEKERALNQPIKEFRTFGKHFLICFPSFTIRIHFLLFGSFSIDEQVRLNKAVRLKLVFDVGTVYFYTCAVKILDESLDDIYDWSTDVMNKAWSPRKAKQKLLQHPKELICDELLDQDIFAGVGNIIKNEVLFKMRVHPESKVGAIPSTKLAKIVSTASSYSFDFLAWRREFVLIKNLKAHGKKICPRCQVPLIKKHTGKKKRRSFFCKNCQVKYSTIS